MLTSGSPTLPVRVSNSDSVSVGIDLRKLYLNLLVLVTVLELTSGSPTYLLELVIVIALVLELISGSPTYLRYPGCDAGSVL